MWYPVSLKIVNLFSYKEATFNFLKGKLVPIYGVNKTDKNTLSNGSGKSSIGNVISIALTGSPLKKISKKSIIRRGETSGVYEFLLKNDVTGQELLIKETCNKTGSNKVEIYESGQLNEQLKDMSPVESHKYILKLIDIAEDDLLNYYLLSKTTYQPFFATKDSVKKEIVNRFSKADIIDPIDGFIKTDVDKVEEQLVTTNETLIAKNTRISVLREQIVSLREVDIEEEKRKEIEALELQIVGLSDKSELLEKEIQDIKIKIDESNRVLKAVEDDKEYGMVLETYAKRIDDKTKELQKERQTFLDIDKKYEPIFQKIVLDIQEKENQIDANNKLIKEHNSSIDKIERFIADEIECPSCHHKFCLRDKEYNLESGREELKKLQIQKELLVAQNKEKEKTIEAYKQDKITCTKEKDKEQSSSVTKGQSLKKELTTLQEEEVSIQDKYKAHLERIRQLKLSIQKEESNKITKQTAIDINTQQIEGLLQQIDNRGKIIIEDKIKPLEKQIEDIENELSYIDLQKIELESKKESLITWRTRFKKFKSYLANNSISSIESLTNYYLQGMGTHLSCTINGYREKADGTLKEEITAEISTDGGVSSESYYEFSGGECGKIDVACILAMQKLINLNSQSGGLDLLLIDEVIDSIDRIALNELVMALDKIEQTILLISHIELPEMENAVKVEKKLGISYITQN